MRRSALLLLVSFLAAQTAPEVEITAEPHHHLILENRSVRVFSVDVPAHTETLMHRHRHDYIYVTLGAGEVVNQVKDRPLVTIKLQDGQTEFLAGNFSHIARNDTDKPFRNVTIEILEDAKLREAVQSGRIHWDEERGLDILHGGTEEILWVKDGIRASLFELQLGGVLPKLSHPYLLIALSAVALMPSEQLHGATPSYVPKEAQLASGDAKWFASGNSPSLANVGQTARFVTLEFP